jgi:RHH-type proline utilization regulon transcriptional repressor/proline dehydrogenase/delta 1-pyrroline-5-carboxylate dehydrogenase
VDFGLTSGLHSLDEGEIRTWLDRVQAGNLYINRGITGAIVRRQPFGGWKKSAVGPGFKAGGPNYLVGLGRWRRTTASAPEAPLPAAVSPLLAAVEDDGFLARSFRSDAEACAAEFGAVRDVSALGVEQNLFRYVPVPVLVRLAAGGSYADLARVVGAGLVAGSPVTISSATELPGALARACAQRGITVRVQPEEAWLAGAAALEPGRIRLVGAEAGPLLSASGGRPDLAVHDHPVTEAGRIELLPFLAEQAISITGHRFGTPNGLAERLL